MPIFAASETINTRFGTEVAREYLKSPSRAKMIPLLENKTILVVDDNEDIRNLLKAILEQAGASVTAARSVREAIDVFRNSPPHAVVLDIRLGASDGYALIEEIRKINA